MGAKASSLASLNDTAPALRVRDLRKTYDNGTQALKGVSLEVARVTSSPCSAPTVPASRP